MPGIQHQTDGPASLGKGELLANWTGEINPGDVLKIQYEAVPPLGAYSLGILAPEFTYEGMPRIDLAGHDAIVTLPGLRPVSSAALGPAPWQPAAVKVLRWSSAIAPTLALDFTLVLHLDFNQREVLEVYHGDARRPGSKEEADLFHGPWLSLTWWGVLRQVDASFSPSDLLEEWGR